MAEESLASVRADAQQRVPSLPPTEDVLEDAGRQRLASYYLYGGLLAGLIRDDALIPERWPPELAEPMQRLNLSRLAPRTGGGLDAQLTPAQQATRRSPDREQEFARLVVDLINNGAFGPLCARADQVRLAQPGERSNRELELVKDGSVVQTCPVKDHWELVAQYLAAAPVGDSATDAGSPTAAGRTTAWLKTSGVGHAVSIGTTLAVHLHPIGFAAGLGTKLVETRVQAGRNQADALHGLGEDLRALQADADREVANLEAGGTR